MASSMSGVQSEIYQVLQKAQGSAVPVFLGMIDLKLFLFLHGAGDIRHMLLMGWAGESIENVKDKEVLSREISRSKREIRMLGVVHKDLRSANMLWNNELHRVLIIDFHRTPIAIMSNSGNWPMAQHIAGTVHRSDEGALNMLGETVSMNRGRFL
ncbi:predicted protein [Histoplasma capsulatum G186AR]|uniref:Protein kinase domain-containing protein n=1 Tax=Ajellomyces capsulatus (strain G186AR / H82 / ATCC MYA-2454 / RMSCC 2432) TaxID=447093 RepID=C0NVT7_AJECG|nr:uncharacterized protein HCBG_07267 [Histoplasma capsulatum G186AR]EEH04626.1 predicted protein [Histoplasma capsulatum G186AR]